MRIVGIVCRLDRLTKHFIIIEVVNVPVRSPWNQHEVALLIDAYLRIAKGADLRQTAECLSLALRRLAKESGQQVDDTYRNVNGMKMQLANVQYLFTEGQRGLSGASAMIRQMYGLYKSNPAEYQTVLKEAIRLAGINVPIEDAFFSYAQEHTRLSREMLTYYLQKAADFCHLKQPLLGITDLTVVRSAQQKVAEGKLLRFHFGKDAQNIRNVTQLYYSFVKSYHNKRILSITEPVSSAQTLEHTVQSVQLEMNKTQDKQSEQDPNNMPEDCGNSAGLDGFRNYLIQEQHLAERTAGNYWTSIRMIERYILQNALPYSLANTTANDAQSVADALMSRPDFIRINDERHHQYSAAMTQYVSYLRKKTHTVSLIDERKQPTSSRTLKDTVVQADKKDFVLTKTQERISSFISEVFPNGIRPTSIIDINKLKRVFQTKFGEVIPAEVDLAVLLANTGFTSGEKIYFLTDDQKQSLRNLVISIVGNGHLVIYYSELLSLHSDLFEACHIFETTLIQTVLKSILPNYIYKTDWMLADRSASEIEELTRAFASDTVLTYQQLKNRCPYLTMNVIKWALSRSDRFVWTSPETYAQTDLIELDQNEVSDIVNRVVPLIQKEGYFSLAQLHIEESCGMNPLVSSSAVRDAIYIRYLSNQFTRNGLIVKRPEIKLTTYQLLETWLKGLNQVTLTEVEDYERELTGHHAVLGIAAASNTMIRIDHDHYVSDASIQFDVEAIDHAISLFVANRIIPITAITSYTSFPDVPGYDWNLYLVESFLRRFSKRFTIDGGPAQMSYVGGICSADRHFENYEDRLAHAVIQDGVTMTEDAIGRYLTERKYILRRSETVRKTLERARILNEQRGETSVRI